MSILRDRLGRVLKPSGWNFFEAGGDGERGLARLGDEVERYKHAFETTAQDRDRWRQKYEQSSEALPWLYQQFAKQAGVDRPLPLAPAPPVSDLMNQIEEGTVGSTDPPNEGPTFLAPNVFCVGALKSGTSYLYSALRLHSQIQMTEKDSGHLGALHHDLSARKLQKFLEHVAKNPANTPILCEFDVDFAARENSAETIGKHLNPNARIILCLRNPVDRLVSHYAMRVRQYRPGRRYFREPLSLGEALEAEQARIARYGLKECIENFFYVEHGLYHRMVESYFDVFGRDNVLVLIFEEDIRDQPALGLLKVLSFLGLRDLEAVEIASKDHRQFHEASSRPEEPLRVAIELADSRVLPINDAPTDQLVEGNVTRIIVEGMLSGATVLDARDPKQEAIDTAPSIPARHAVMLSPPLRHRLRQYFDDDINQLEAMLGRKIDIWRQ